jgi:hypothetical protein
MNDWIEITWGDGDDVVAVAGQVLDRPRAGRKPTVHLRAWEYDREGVRYLWWPHCRSSTSRRESAAEGYADHRAVPDLPEVVTCGRCRNILDDAIKHALSRRRTAAKRAPAAQRERAGPAERLAVLMDTNLELGAFVELLCGVSAAGTTALDCELARDALLAARLRRAGMVDATEDTVRRRGRAQARRWLREGVPQLEPTDERRVS